MKINRHHLAEIIAEKTMKVTDPDRLAKEIAAYLMSIRHTSEIDSLLRDVMQYRAEKGLVEVTAVSAHPINNLVRDDIKAIVKTHYPHVKHIFINEVQDESVIGGVKLVFANEQLDLSVQAKLNAFKRRLSERKS